MRAIAFVLFLGGLLAACSTSHPTDAREGWSPVPNRYAKHFEVLKRGPERLVLVFSDTLKHDTIGAYRFGTDTVSGAFALPTRRIILGSTTHVPFMSALDGLDAVIGCTHLADVRDSLARKRMAANGVQEVLSGDGLDRERVLAMHPWVLLGYPFGRQEGDRMGQLGVPVMEVAEYLEEHPLGKAEWLRFFGVLLGREAQADSLFGRIAERYEATRSRPWSGSAPKVFFGSCWRSEWFVPPGNSYMAQLITDAGGAYLFADRRGSGNITLDAEATIGIGGKAQVWGTVLASPDVVTENAIAYNDARILALPAFRQHRTFYGNSAESDLFGDAALHPDMLLADLRAILHPDSIGTIGVYFRTPAQNGIPNRR